MLWKNGASLYAQSSALSAKRAGGGKKKFVTREYFALPMHVRETIGRFARLTSFPGCRDISVAPRGPLPILRSRACFDARACEFGRKLRR